MSEGRYADKIIGQYTVVAKIGEGGMGEVYRARDTKLGRDVAIKVLPAAFSEDSARLARFEQEAQAAGSLNHPNILVIFHIGMHEGAPYIVSELLEGETLRERMAGGALPQRKAIDYALQTARGLAAAHEKGIVHRDIKPDNVFVTNDGRVKILDFGLAKLSGASEAIQSQTEAPTRKVNTDPGTVMGTMGYMSPEQLKGVPADNRSDIFSFGAILYEMLSGKRAFRGDSMAETMSAILREDPPDLSESNKTVSPALERVVHHCLEKNPAERFHSARDLAFAIESLSGTATTSGPTGFDPVARGPHMRTGALIAAAMLALAAVGWAVGYFSRAGSSTTGTSMADITYQPVTFEEGFVFAARFAKDGRTIVYSGDREQQPRDVFVTSVDRPEFRPLGLPGADLLALSPSGDLAILTGSIFPTGNPYIRFGTLSRASLMGGSPRPELENVRFADFGPDGTMAVARQYPSRITLEFPTGHVLDETSMITDNGLNSTAGFTMPRVSPDGKHVAAFKSEGQGAWTVKIYSRSGVLVAQSETVADWWGLAWRSPNEVWFAGTEPGSRQPTVFGLNLAGSQRRILRQPTLTLHDITTEGDILASFDHVMNRLELLTSGNDVPRDQTWREGGELVGVADNQVVLFAQPGDSGGPKGSTYVWRPGESQPVRIADGIGLLLSADGAMALVGSNDSPMQLSIVPTGAGQPRALDIGPVARVGWASWLSDGVLVMSLDRPNAKPSVELFSTAGGAPIGRLPEGVVLRGGRLASPDGSRIAAIDPQGQLLICSFATSTCQPVAGSRPGDEVAGWSADNNSLFVYQRNTVSMQIDQIDARTGRRAPWKTIHPKQSALNGLARAIVTPDGAVAYWYRKARSELYVIRGVQ
jgi:hypothetical protein